MPVVPKCPVHALADRFRGLQAVGALVGVDADAFAIAVIDGDEQWATPSASDTLEQPFEAVGCRRESGWNLRVA